MQSLTLRAVIVWGLVLIVVVLGGSAALLYLRNDAAQGAWLNPGSQSTSAKGTAELAELREKLSKLEARLESELQAKGNSEEQKARGKARLVTARARVKDSRLALDELDREITAWNKRLPELLKGELGRRLSSRTSAVEQFAALYERPRASREAAESLREQMKSLVGPVEAASAGGEPNNLLSEALVQDLEKLFQSAQDALREYEQARFVIDTLLSDGAKSELGKGTLQEALQGYQTEQARVRAEQIASARKAGHDEVTKKLMALEAEAEKSLGEIELKRASVRQAEEKLKREQALAAEQQALERKRLEARFAAALPEIRRVLRPFITDGYAQPRNWRFERTANKGPVSFAALQGGGYLTKDVKGLQRLHAANVHNDRELGAFPSFLGGDQDFAQKQEALLRAQNLLNEFGPLLVEKGMLAP